MSVAATLAPLLVALAAIYMLSEYVPRTWAEFWSVLVAPTHRGKLPPFSVRRAVQAFTTYTLLANQETHYMRRSYASLSRAHKHIGYDLGYPKKLDKRDEATVFNSVITDAIASLACEEHKLTDIPSSREGVDSSDLGRVRESLKHFIRDWSQDGKRERDVILEPILEVMRRERSPSNETQTVLFPGSGLSRLAWDVSQLGYQATANEISPFMYLSLQFLLSPKTTTRRDQHSLRPYAHWFSHSRSYSDTYRSISFPDVIPRLSDEFRLLDADFLRLDPPAGAGYDYVVTLFFIDTSLNIIQTLEQIYKLLKPGGKWINLGPLLWTGGAQASLELSLDEVMTLAKQTGFVFETEKEDESRRTVDCEYTADSRAMMSWVYHAEFWVAQKPLR